MASRWDVTRSVRESDLPAPARLIMLTLADRADVDTAAIPAQFSPSLTEIAQETGLDRSTVTRHLNLLDTAGWLKRSRPSTAASWVNGDRTQYALLVGSLGAQRNQVHSATRCTEPLPQVQSATGVGAESTTGSDLLTGLPEPKSVTSEIALRPDVERICEHLADRIVGNGCKRPTITNAWRTAARLLIDKDGRSEENIIRAIDWCQDDEFWRGNIESMPKLRKQYDRLRLQATRRNGNGSLPKGYVIRDGRRLKAETASHLDEIERYAALDRAEQLASGMTTPQLEGLAS